MNICPILSPSTYLKKSWPVCHTYGYDYNVKKLSAKLTIKPSEFYYYTNLYL